MVGRKKTKPRRAKRKKLITRQYVLKMPTDIVPTVLEELAKTVRDFRSYNITGEWTSPSEGKRVFSTTNIDDLISEILRGQKVAELALSSLIIPERKVAEGVLIKSTSVVWDAIVERLRNNWSEARQIPPEKWEELIAGAFERAGFNEVTLTPRSGDHGRDVIAVRKGVGCVKIIGSVKAYRPGHLVGYDDVRALLGVMSGERDTSKGIISTTSDFQPNIVRDPFIAPFLPTRLELMNGEQLKNWLSDLFKKKR